MRFAVRGSLGFPFRSGWLRFSVSARRPFGKPEWKTIPIEVEAHIFPRANRRNSPAREKTSGRARADPRDSAISL